MPWPNRTISNIVKQVNAGATLQEVADDYGVSKQYISRILWDHRRDFMQKRRIAIAKAVQARKDEKVQRIYNMTRGRLSWHHADAHSLCLSRKLGAIARRIEKSGAVFDLFLTDLVFPTHCPVLGIKLNYYATSISDNSPSFDRLVAKKGYVPGNVIIVSNRANRIRNDGSVGEHLKIARFYKNRE